MTLGFAGSPAGNTDNDLKEQTQRMLSGKKVPRPLLPPNWLQAAQLDHVLMTLQYFASPCLRLYKPLSAHGHSS